jgi:hypothetical protein
VKSVTFIAALVKAAVIMSLTTNLSALREYPITADSYSTAKGIG